MTETADASEERSALWLSCWDYEGQACTTPGNRFRCYNQYPYEPGICVCGSSYTYFCG
ncbi:MAG: hypothetical protein JXB05_11545 [Myxococcaceae bacterium]|nr:hypothetical protein [Myxococcaceae bacterium]